MRGSEAARVLEQPPPDVFELTLPATVSNGVPGAGARNLEKAASGDVYEFATAMAGGLRIGVSSCASSLGYAVDWKLVDAVSGATVGSASTCSAKSLSSVAAGSYRLRVTRNGRTGTYKLDLGPAWT